MRAYWLLLGLDGWVKSAPHAERPERVEQPAELPLGSALQGDLPSREAVDSAMPFDGEDTSRVTPRSRTAVCQVSHS